MNACPSTRSLLTSLLIAPLLSACGALPASQTLDPPGARGAPAADPPPLTETASPAPAPRVRTFRKARPTRKANATRKTKAARKAKARTSTVRSADAPVERMSASAPGPAQTAAAPSPAPDAPTASPDPAPPLAGARHLARLHPEVRRMARALHTEAAAEGIELKFISGHRAFDRHSKKARAGRASWHAFGMAFDVNLAHRTNMKDALAHYRRDRATWARVGAIAERLGLTWGVQWGRHEVFHFEWHPGMPDAIRRPTLTRLLEDAGSDGRAIEKVWRRFPIAPTGPESAVANREAD